MMICPECYYELYLKGKSAEQIMRVIRGLKREIGHLKNTMEDSKCSNEPEMRPSKSTRLKCNRLYLERAKQALVDVGVVYEPSKAEVKVLEFDNNIPFINKVIFSIGGFHEGYEIRTFILDDASVYVNVEHSGVYQSNKSVVPIPYCITKEELLDGIHRLHIGEWRKKYDLRRYGYAMLDGTQWELEIQFANDHKPVKIYGENAYPYNFDELRQLVYTECDEIKDADE